MSRISRIGRIIHPTAIVAEGAKLAEGVEVGPYVVIGSRVEIGANTRIAGHVVIEGDTRIGEECSIFPGACIGTASQDKKTKGAADAYLRIGSGNVIREYVTINCGGTDGSGTLIGDRNLLMAYCHVAHDCVLGNEVVMANNAGLAGHVTVEDKAVIGGFTGVHQFVRIGKLSMTGGLSKVTMDVPPFSLCDGHPMKFCGLNVVGLKRAGYASKDLLELRRALKILFASGLHLQNAVRKVKETVRMTPEVEYTLAFIKGSKRGIARVGKLVENKSD
ncbi:MAG: acyl-ACP--UDP-N-acetylglucosamine O-acyltransferase [Candidatus Omnitrophica bacterium]|nr:acyl-ACP--UDP-N-acetylglucosamine O-acyltransferase [Candidatus Omnitrophota bacterium]